MQNQVIHLRNYQKQMRVERIPYWNIIILGLGGNGGYILRHVAQMMRIFNQQGIIVAADGDVVEEKNLRNQLFLPKDVGRKKAEVLANRYRAHYNVDIVSYDADYIEDIPAMKRLFDYDEHQAARVNWYKSYYMPVLIGAVDNNFTRKLMHRFFTTYFRDFIYIDVGVESAWFPTDGRPKEHWTKEELERHNETGYTGQVVTGLKLFGDTVLEPVAGMYPELLQDTADAPSQQSCSELVVSEPQRLITNQMAAMAVGGVINELFDTNTISTHVTHLNAKRNYMRGEFIPTNDN